MACCPGLNRGARVSPKAAQGTLQHHSAEPTPLIGPVTRTNYGNVKNGDTITIKFQDYPPSAHKFSNVKYVQ